MPQQKSQFNERLPLSIVPVENGYKVYPAEEQYAYSNPDPGNAIPNSEFVFNELDDVFEFLREHFNRDKNGS